MLLCATAIGEPTKTTGEIIPKFTRPAAPAPGVTENSVTWLATSDSGAPIYGAGGDNNFGLIRSSSIENSNVDLSEQLVKLIVAQQAYQANSQTITTEKSLVETVLRI